MITAQKIEKIVATGALHVLYREDGGWYHHLKRFPGALFDSKGYVIFETEEAYRNNPFLTHRHDLNIKEGLFSLPGYIKFSEEQIRQIESLKSAQNILDTSEQNIFNKVQLDLASLEEENSNFLEGGSKMRLVSYYERNPKLRAKAIQIHGTTCIVCQFNFKEYYGEHGEDYIEVHHLVPIHSLDKSIVVNPVTDMVVLCANCHRMIHRKKEKTLSIEELIRLRKNAKN